MFADSAIVDLTPYRSTEACSRFPDDIFPSFAGSGRFGMGIDASGLQAVNSNIASTRGKEAPAGNGNMDDLYLIHGGMLSEHLFWEDVETADDADLPEDARHVRDGTADEIDAEGTLDHTYKNHREHFMPLGFLTYDLVVDGTRISGADLANHVRGEWERETDLQRGCVTTSFVVADAVTLDLTVFAPHDGHRVYVRATLDVYDGVLGEMAEPHDVRFEPQLRLATRSGRPIYDEPDAITCNDQTAVASITSDSKYNPHEAYTTVYGVGATNADTEVTPDSLDAEWETTVDGPTTCDFVFAFHPVRDAETESVERTVRGHVDDLTAASVDDQQQQHESDWRSFFARTADVSFERPGIEWRKEEYLLHASEYLMRCGHDFRQGASTCFYLHHQLLFHAAKWWDFHFMVDGVLRANMTDEAGHAVDWLDAIMATEGRPFSYMLAYDGRPLIDPHREIVDMQVAAHASSVWKYYESNGDDELLESTVYPIVRRAADYAVDELFEERDGRYRLIALGHDSGGHTDLTSNRTFHAAWFLTALRKAIEYAESLDTDTEARNRWQTVLDGFEFAADDEQYHFAEGVEPSDFDSEPPYFTSRLLYPTEAMADIDFEKFRRTRERSPPIQINKPWMSFAQASTDYRAGDIERAAEQYALGRDRAFGIGFFKEIGAYGADGNVIPPFATAHGAHLTALLEQFAMTDITEGTVNLLTNLPPYLRGDAISFENVRTLSGIVVSGDVDTHRTRLELANATGAGDVTFRIQPPIGVPRDALQTIADGEPVETEWDEKAVIVTLPFDADERKEVVLESERRG
ncbi:glycosyl hydrolase family 95 catalytic domain-containing protein [Haladaptatus sp. NG-SE-30]